MFRNKKKTETKLNIDEKKEEYIWVEGYKGTDKNMVCDNRNESFPYILLSPHSDYTQYELNRQFDLEGEPVVGRRGFYFCLNLKDVFNYYDFNFSNRFFKVKAYVRKSDYEAAKDSNDTNLAAKSIILTEEVFPDYQTVEESGDLLCKSSNVDYKYKISKDEFEDITVRHKYKNVNELIENKFKEGMLKYGYSETFIFVLLEKYSCDVCKLLWIFEKAKAFVDENVSKDMAVYLLLN